jgi:hypothetical protein
MDAATIGSMLASFFILFAASLALGVAIGLGGAWLIKRTRAGGDRHAGTPGALGLLCTSAYLAYLAGDAAGLSGIVALFCAAVVLAHYGLPSLTRTDRVAVRAAVGAASLVAEGAIFAFVGLAALDPGQWGRTHWPSALGIASAVLLLMLASRAAWLAPVVWAHNRWGGTAPLSRREGGAAWWAGSMRGAVSVALVCFYYGEGGAGGPAAGAGATPGKASTLVSATLIVVLVSTLGFGAVTKPVLERLLGSGGAGGGVEAGVVELAARPPPVAALAPKARPAAPAAAATAATAAAASAAAVPPPPLLPPLVEQGSMEEVSLLGNGGGRGEVEGEGATTTTTTTSTAAASFVVAASWPAAQPPHPNTSRTPPPPLHWQRSGAAPGSLAAAAAAGTPPTCTPPPHHGHGQPREFVDWWTAFDARVMRPVFSRPGEGGRGGSGGGDDGGGGATPRN